MKFLQNYKYAILLGSIVVSSPALATTTDSFLEQEYYNAFPSQRQEIQSAQQTLNARKFQQAQMETYRREQAKLFTPQNTIALNQDFSQLQPIQRSQGLFNGPRIQGVNLANRQKSMEELTYNNTNEFLFPDRSKEKYGFELGLNTFMGTSQFEFTLDVGSKLRWFDMQTQGFEFTLKKDFYNLSGEGYFVNFSYADATTDSSYTVDDDVENALSVISVGNGDGQFNQYKLGIGYTFVDEANGLKISPSIGLKTKKVDFKMNNHKAPDPYFYTCANPKVTIVDGVEEKDCKIGTTISLGDPSSIDPNTIYVEELYDSNGDQVDLSTALGLGSGEDGFYVNNGSLIAGPTGYDEILINVLDTNGNVVASYTATMNSDQLVESFGNYAVTDYHPSPSHIYNTTWEGIYLGLDIEKEISKIDFLTFSTELFYGSYTGEGIWPLRDDFAQNPSFEDTSSSSWGIYLNLMYNRLLNDNWAFFAGFEYDYLITPKGNAVTFFTDGSQAEGELEDIVWKYWGIKAGVKAKF